MKLHGKKRLFQLFKERDVALVLHGHVHVNGEYVRKGVQFVNGGGSLLGSSGGIAFNLITIRPESIENRIVTIPDEQPAVPAAARIPELQAA